MRAIVHSRFGPPAEVLNLEEVEAPSPGPGEVLVRVAADAVAKGDWLIAHGWPYIARPSYGFRTPKQRIAGLEFAGTVEAVGDGATRFSVGVAVFGWGNGSLADLVSVPEENLAPKPEGVGFEQAAAIPVSGFAALQAVRDSGEVEEGQQVLVIGASGGVGSYAVQIAKALGGEVTGVCSTRNVEMVRSLGADHVLDYTRDEIPAGRYDVIVDIAGNRSLSELRRALVPKGTLVIVGGSGGRWTMGFGRTIRAMLLSPFVGHSLKALLSSPNQEDLAALAALVAEGEVTPAVGNTYPLEQAAEAIEHVGAGRSRGKTVVTIDGTYDASGNQEEQ
jgi:NADPH:quinone reductase-like Zn-dependent oxidoreductase